MRNTANDQPNRIVILEELERLERADGTKKEIEQMKNGDGKKRGRGNDQNKKNREDSNWCRKEGHDHLWKDCLGNPRNTKR